MALSAVMVLGLITGCRTKTSDPDKSQNKVRTDIVVAWKVDVANPDPQRMNDAVSQRVIRMMFDCLVAIDENEKPIPALAESWEIKSETEYILISERVSSFTTATSSRLLT